MLAVILYHETYQFPSLHLAQLFRDGWMGVDLFFVVLGFLITRILIRNRNSEGYFKNFYARRCLRIWPLYYALLLAIFVLIPMLRPSETAMFEPKSAPWWAYPFYLQNFLVPIPNDAFGPLGVTWSLAIEEQFYLIWPLVIRFCSLALLRRIALAIICLSPAWRMYATMHDVRIYTNLFCRLDGLMAGALIATLVDVESFVPGRWIRLAWGGFVLLTPLGVLASRMNATWAALSFSAIGSASLVYLSLFSGQKQLRTVMTNRFLVHTGTISYGLYLLHKISIDAVLTARLDRMPLAGFIAGLIGSFVLATLSWNILEQPFLRLKRFFPPRPRGAQIEVGRPSLVTGD